MRVTPRGIGGEQARCLLLAWGVVHSHHSHPWMARVGGLAWMGEMDGMEFPCSTMPAYARLKVARRQN